MDEKLLTLKQDEFEGSMNTMVNILINQQNWRELKSIQKEKNLLTINDALSVALDRLNRFEQTVYYYTVIIEKQKEHIKNSTYTPKEG